MDDVLFYIAVGLSLIGVIITFLYGVRLLASAFKESALWGIAFLLVPFAALIYIVRFWQETRKLVIGQLIGSAFVVAAVLVAPASFRNRGDEGMAKRKKEAAPKEISRDLERAALLQAENKDRARQLYGYLQNWQAELKAKTPAPNAPAAEVDAFNREHTRYIGLLEEYKTMAKALASPTPAR